MGTETQHGTPRAVLIVEDSPDFSNLLKYIIQDDGFEGIQFPLEGEDIVDWAKKHKPAIILMDLALRRKDGREYINQLKADPATKKIPILIISGRDLSFKEITELKLKDVKYLRKGRVEIEEIRKEIRTTARGGAPARPQGKEE